MKFRTAAATKTEAATYGWFAVVPSGFNNANKEGPPRCSCFRSTSPQVRHGS
jgi:hypothetical protein